MVKTGLEVADRGRLPAGDLLRGLRELKLIVELTYECGLEEMHWCTSAWGDYVTDATKAEMEKVLTEIPDSSFAKNWVEKYRGGLKEHHTYRAAELRAPAGDQPQAAPQADDCSDHHSPTS